MDATRHILETFSTWAVVGISNRPGRAGWSVPLFLEERGYRIVPVNPNLERWEGEEVFPDLSSVPFPIEVVDLFRRSELVLPHVDEAIRIGAKVVWMQLGVEHAEAARKAREAGLLVVEDRCPVIETHRHWPQDDGPRF
jgi:O-acetylhomoserine (thiol)-lyase